MSINPTNSTPPISPYDSGSEAPDNESIEKENPSNRISPLLVILVTVVAVSALAAAAKKKRASAPILVEEKVDVQALETTLARLKKVSACLSGKQNKFYKNLRKLPDDIRAGFCEIVRPPLVKLSEDMQAALAQFKKGDEYPLIVKNCNGIADPEKVALAKLFFDSKIHSIEEALSL